MERRTLKWFDESIKILQDAKEQYKQEKYLESYNMTEEAQKLCQRLQSHIDHDVFTQKHEQYGGWSNLTDEEIEKLSELNRMLSKLEVEINKEGGEIVNMYEERMKSTGASVNSPPPGSACW